MDIGTEKPAITIEPIEDPFRREVPAEPTPERVPVPVREREREKVLA
jgi:hypothetical protein